MTVLERDTDKGICDVGYEHARIWGRVGPYENTISQLGPR